MSAVRSWSVQLTPVLHCTVYCIYSALQDRPHLYLACSTRLLHSSDCERNSCDEKHLRVPSVDYFQAENSEASLLSSVPEFVSHETIADL